MIYTTLNAIREHGPCENGWKKLLKHLGKKKADDKRLALTTVLKSNGIVDAIWCLRAVTGHDREICLYAVWCARQAQHLMKDARSLAEMYVAERHANGEATDAELAAAWVAELAAAWVAARAAAWVAARAAAWDAAWVAAGAAAWAAAWAAARDARDAAGDAEWAARDAQAKQFRKVFGRVKS